MPNLFLDSIAIITNGLTLAMALSFGVIVLWHDRSKPVNQFFAVFIATMMTWSAGSLLFLAVSSLDVGSDLLPLFMEIMTIGFMLSSVAIYALAASLVSTFSRRFQVITWIGIAVLLSYQLVGVWFGPAAIYVEERPNYEFERFSAVFFWLFSITTLYLLWRYRARIDTLSLKLGIALFVIGQGLTILNPTLENLLVSIIVCSVASLVISTAILRQEIIFPLRQRISQIESMHRVNLAVTSQLSVDMAVQQMAKQASDWLNADGTGIFLYQGDRIELVAQVGLVDRMLHMRLPTEAGIVGTVIRSQKSIRLANYAEDWPGADEIPYAKETFGSLACVPLTYGNEALGALMVISGKHSRVFQPEDVHLLELLGAQAAVAITNSRLFTRQSMLAYEIESARNQLETVLTSTENPVVAVNRQLELIFANKAATRLFPDLDTVEGVKLTRVLPFSVLPIDYHQVIRDIRQKRSHVYEIVIDDRIYLCHLATLGGASTIEGWVAILNDVTELKELDRLKSEMVRLTSHDLKNPLQAAMANLDLLRDAIDDADTDDIDYSLKKIEQQLERMYRIISGVLDLERLRKGTSASQICVAERIVKRVAVDLTVIAKDQQINLITEIEPGLPNFLGDPGQFERALVNLVENAIKFSTSGDTVTVRVHHHSSVLQFEVQDEGIGIPIEDQPRVFDSFFRANQRGAEHISGSGLGLHLVKTIVQQHRGEVWLTSQEGTGTTFYISIPVMSDGIIPTSTSAVI